MGEGKYGDEREILWLEGFGEEGFVLHCIGLIFFNNRADVAWLTGPCHISMVGQG